MPVPTHFKINFRGIFTSTPEEWSFGLHFDRDVADQPDAELSDINAGGVTSAITDLLATAGGMFSDACLCTEWRAYVIGTNGRMEGNPMIEVLTPPGVGGTATKKYPPQIALAVTLVADNRGPARFGRFFLPGVNLPMDNDHRLTVSNATNVAEAVTTFLKDISDAIDLPLTVSSSTALNISSLQGGVKQAVDHVEVGRVYDTLRSRRRQLLEERHVHGQIDW